MSMCRQSVFLSKFICEAISRNMPSLMSVVAATRSKRTGVAIVTLMRCGCCVDLFTFLLMLQVIPGSDAATDPDFDDTEAFAHMKVNCQELWMLLYIQSGEESGTRSLSDLLKFAFYCTCGMCWLTADTPDP